MEKALEGVVKQERVEVDPREVMNLALQKKNIDAELLRVRQQLADGSKVGGRGQVLRKKESHCDIDPPQGHVAISDGTARLSLNCSLIHTKYSLPPNSAVPMNRESEQPPELRQCVAMHEQPASLRLCIV